MNQCDKIIKYLQAGNTLTPGEAMWQVDTYALSQRMGEIKKKGYHVFSKWVKTGTGKRVKQYSIPPDGCML